MKSPAKNKVVATKKVKLPLGAVSSVTAINEALLKFGFDTKYAATGYTTHNMSGDSWFVIDIQDVKTKTVIPELSFELSSENNIINLIHITGGGLFENKSYDSYVGLPAEVAKHVVYAVINFEIETNSVKTTTAVPSPVEQVLSRNKEYEARAEAKASKPLVKKAIVGRHAKLAVIQTPIQSSKKRIEFETLIDTSSVDGEVDFERLKSCETTFSKLDLMTAFLTKDSTGEDHPAFFLSLKVGKTSALVYSVIGPIESSLLGLSLNITGVDCRKETFKRNEKVIPVNATLNVTSLATASYNTKESA